MSIFVTEAGFADAIKHGLGRARDHAMSAMGSKSADGRLDLQAAVDHVSGDWKHYAAFHGIKQMTVATVVKFMHEQYGLEIPAADIEKFANGEPVSDSDIKQDETQPEHAPEQVAQSEAPTGPTKPVFGKRGEAPKPQAAPAAPTFGKRTTPPPPETTEQKADRIARSALRNMTADQRAKLKAAPASDEELSAMKKSLKNKMNREIEAEKQNESVMEGMDDTFNPASAQKLFTNLARLLVRHGQLRVSDHSGNTTMGSVNGQNGQRASRSQPAAAQTPPTETQSGSYMDMKALNSKLGDAQISKDQIKGWQSKAKSNPDALLRLMRDPESAQSLATFLQAALTSLKTK